MGRGLAGLSWMALAACQASGWRDGGAPPHPVQTDPTAQDYVSPKLPRARVLLHDAFGGVHAVEAEVAATASSRERGLMWRTALAEGKGMLFIFNHESIQSFWMRNTLIPLDMLFISQGHKVVGIVENAEPQTLNPRGVPYASTYVLEVPAGWTAKVGIQPPSAVEIEGIAGIRAEP